MRLGRARDAFFRIPGMFHAFFLATQRENQGLTFATRCPWSTLEVAHGSGRCL